MDRGAWQATVHGEAESGTSKHGTKSRETLLICQGPRPAASSPHSAEVQCCRNKTTRDVLAN